MATLDDVQTESVTLADLVPTEENYSTFDSFFSSNEEVSRSQRLEKARQEKLAKYSLINQGASLDSSYTDLGGGRIESNKNKVWNSLNDQEIQSLMEYGLNNYTLTQDEEGNLVYSSGESYSGPTRRLYMFGTNSNPDEVKFGLARGDLSGAEARYQDTGILGDYGWAPGEGGVNTNDKRMDILLPYNVATMLEGLAHGREAALGNRVVPDIYSDPDAYAKYGSGASEYYTSKEGLFGAPTEVDLGLGEELFGQYIGDMQRRNPKGGIVDEDINLARIQRENQEYAADNSGILDRASNTISGFTSSFVDSLVVSPADAIGDLTGLYDIGSDEENTAMVNEFFEYNPVQAERAIENIGKQWETVADDNASTSERVRAAGNGILEAFITPEMWGTSMGMLTSWITPGVVLKGVGVGSKFAKTAKALDAAADAGTITKNAARTQKAAAFLSVDGAKAALASQSGFMVSALGEVNKQYNDFVANNNGVELEGADKAEWFAGRFAVQMVNQNLEKLVDFKLLKSTGIISGIIPAVKAMTNKEFANVAKTMAKGATVTASSMGQEAAQEYTQTMMELFNSRYGSAQFKDVDTFKEFLSDERNLTEAGIAALAGAGGAPQFEAFGYVSKTPIAAVKGIASAVNAINAGKQPARKRQDIDEVDISSTAEANKARAAKAFNFTPTDSVEQHTPSADVSITTEDTATPIVTSADTTSDVDTLPNQSGPVKDGWKLHLNPVPGSEQAISDYLKENNIPHKVGLSSGQTGKGMTVYVGSRDAANSVAKDINAKFADTLNDAEGDVLTDDTQIDGKVWGRFDVPNSKDFHQYGASGVPFLNDDMSQIGFAEDRSSFINDAKTRADDILRRRYGTYYTGTTSTADVGTASDILETSSTVDNPTLAYYAAIGSDNTELKQKASKLAVDAKTTLLDGTNTVFKSDDEFSIKLKKIKDLTEIAVAEDPNISEVDLINSVIKGLNATNPAQQAQVKESVSEGHSEGLRFASIKPINAVTKEASVGDRGFLTYYAAAKAALAEGDKTSHEAYMGKLESFYLYASNKLERVKAGIDNVRGQIEKAVDILIKSGKASTRAAALDMLRSQYSTSNKQAVVANSGSANAKTTRIGYFDVAANMKNTNYKKGIFSIVESLGNEVTSMGSIYDYLLGKANESLTAGAPKTTVTNETEVSVNEDLKIPAADISVEDGDFTIPAEDNTSAEEDFTIPPEDTTDSTVDFTVTPDEELTVDAEDTADATDEKPNTAKNESVKALSDNAAQRKKIKKLISERNAVLRERNVTGEERLNDPELVSLLEQKTALEQKAEGFASGLVRHIANRLEALKHRKDMKFVLYTNYTNGADPVETTLGEVFKSVVATGFTVTTRTASNTFKFTKKYANKMLENMKVTGKFPSGLFDKIKDNPATFLLFDENGELNYNVVEAMQAATYEYLVQEASNLGGANRTDEEVGELLGIPEEYVSQEMLSALSTGGVTLKLAAAAIGDKVIKNLGLQIKSIQNREALATAFGITALQGIDGDLIESYSYFPSEEERTRKSYKLLAKSIPFIKASTTLFDQLSSVRKANAVVEDTLGVEIDRERTYRTATKKPHNKVAIHRAEYQEAPKDHKEVVNRLEQTAFSFNSGHEVLLEMFSKDGKLDVEALVNHILGTEERFTTFDDKESYKAQKVALERSIMFYQEAFDDVGVNNIFFNWFIAKNHRIHLDSNRLNPQNDKNLSRWLVTTNNSRKSVSKKAVEAVLNGENTTDMAAKMFIYAIVQAFDGVKTKDFPALDANIPGIDKDNESKVIAAAKMLLENTSVDMLKEMALKSKHLGHAALAISNIRKYINNDNFESDMVLEVDGLTNGFAFRSMQFPVNSDNSPVTYMNWLEKVGVVVEDSALFGLNSMNSARAIGQEDVYISVGAIFNKDIASAKADLDSTSAKWIALFEKHKRLPDFSDSDSVDVKSFIRDLMKSPVMIFNYAASIGRIASGLVNDQVMGKGYLKGKGLVSLLTEKGSDGKYLITKDDLTKAFGATLGDKYHKARTNLHKKSINDVRDRDIALLHKDLNKAVGSLYTKSLTNTLETLFGKQTQINTGFVNASQFMFNHFKEQYSLWLLKNPDASEDDKLEFLKDMAAIIPGISAASSDDQLNKITFLKNTLDPTNNDVVINIGGKRVSSNTVSRTFGEPGVGPAVLTVLSLDSSVLAKTINDAYKEDKGAAALPVHDAIVLGIEEYNTINSYNHNFYTTNRGYSISEEFMRAVENFEQSIVGAQNLFIIDNKGNKITFNAMKTALTKINSEIQANRKELFSKNVKVGQLVGPEGTMEVYNISTMKNEAKEYLASIAADILKKLDNKELKTALGKTYAKHIKDINNKLKGCM